MKKKKYVSPELTVVSFRTEVGYAASSNPVDNVAEQINGTVKMGVDGFQLGENEIGGRSTDVSGESGIAAGYFYEENTTGWFSEQ